MRYFFAMLVLVAVALGGAIPHASMVSAEGESHVLVQHHHQATSDPANNEQHHRPADQVMSGACANACLGSVATLLPPIELALFTFNAIVLWTQATLVVRGHLFAPDERPPKFI